MTVLGWMFLAAGAFIMLAALFDWEWFLDFKLGKRQPKRFNRKIERVVYFIMGAIMIAYVLFSHYYV